MAAATGGDGVLFRRIKLLGEILSTERTYVATLHTLLHVFVRPLEQYGLHAPLDPGTSLIFKCAARRHLDFFRIFLSDWPSPFESALFSNHIFALPFSSLLSGRCSNIDQIYVIHTQLLRDIEQHVAAEEKFYHAMAALSATAPDGSSPASDSAADAPTKALPVFASAHGNIASILLKFSGLFSLYAQV
jgi:hypothetical protein